MKVELTEEQISALRVACLIAVKEYGACAKEELHDHGKGKCLKSKAAMYSDLYCMLHRENGVREMKINDATEMELDKKWEVGESTRK